MKVFAKPISSPGRTDEFPPPLMMRFPRSKSSRGSRSRANPMFIRKINAANDTTQEPSSPKVTCIGQVRARRSNKKQTTTAFRRCQWFRKLQPECFRRVWRRSLSFLRCEYGGKSRKLQESEQIEGNQKNEHRKREIQDVIVADDNKVLISESPPRNAFLLTRSRSAPYRSSSFASKNWDVTMETTGRRLPENTGIEEETESINVKIEVENGEDEGSINGVEEFKAKPLNLSRCKSVPARTGDKLSMSFSS
ncbi:uncharacterized protein LOC112520168 [Cynara cardunculus var. scolymus]|uniref:uncharacterized protein LOC112520168 n=1 Tax=Cynara cardunculus var. scolymus TaxID=59895 RepID=UPI000D62A259|nr:uncharacterized protein LOC112520168 [Cynara cardunculus var. scolymus]